MPPNPTGFHDPAAADGLDLAAETQALRRKVTFWRRSAWLVLGGAALVGFIAWHRGEIRRRECFAALTHFAEVARDSKLSEQHPEILESFWQSFDPAPNGNSAMHYDLIVRNWAATPRPGDSLPLAVCRERHLSTTAKGRHVLMKTADGYEIVWKSEDEVGEIVAEARRDNKPK